jgi:hypothetical protein
MHFESYALQIPQSLSLPLYGRAVGSLLSDINSIHRAIRSLDKDIRPSAVFETARGRDGYFRTDLTPSSNDAVVDLSGDIGNLLVMCTGSKRLRTSLKGWRPTSRTRASRRMPNNSASAVVDEGVGVGCGDVVGVDVGDGEVVDSLVTLELAYRGDLDPGAG